MVAGESDAAVVIREALEAIASDPVSAPLGPALEQAWSGHVFDDEMLASSLAELEQDVPEP